MSDLGKVAVLLGGNSAERAVSLRSGEAVARALEESGVEVLRFDPSERPVTDLLTEKVQRVVIMLHGRGGEDGAIQGALQTLGLPYSGSGVLGSALAMDKIRSKRIFEAQGLPTAPYCVVTAEQLQHFDAEQIMTNLNHEIMVKPALEGSSIGMSRVQSADQLQSAIEKALEFDTEVLVEQFVKGLEYTVSVLADEALPSIRMETPRSFYDYEAKYHTDTTSYHCPSGLSEQDEQDIANIALAAFKAVGASGWGRVDIMRDMQGNYYILEVNTVPGMTEKSLVPMAAKQAGMSFSDLVLAVAETCECRR
ncbi:D-alanine--D-alanine ligase [Planctobacterium marinum]|uniref:D-alanine--D-alanine ligase n=1 Tax=Planctobacterium marinum TaxID=1631968 RepID=UPI001E5FAEC5|nr:D-alanine--D-alanine ligase [Planctobacterium marinum]MCC2605390.1 D-alanine--D-alanine ligase [Planctobacterium marinum]